MVGIALTDALDEFIQKQQISPQLAMKVLVQFDKVISDALMERIRVRGTLKVILTYFRDI